MSCALTSSYTYTGCKGGPGGIKEVLITEFDNVTASTIVANVITSMTLVTGKLFRRYILDKEVGAAEGNLNAPNGSVSYEHKVDFTLRGLATSTQAEIKLLAQNSLIMIVRDAEDVYRVYGLTRSMDLKTVPGSTGKASADFKINTLTFTGSEPLWPLEVQTSIIAALLIAAP